MFIALGSNIGDSAKTVREAARRLSQFTSRPLRSSSLWESTPIDCPAGSSNFINAVIGLEPPPDETPESLLARLQGLEAEFGRRPKRILNEPRALDLDLIAFGAETRKTPALTLPHPRAHLRRFVLEPLSEVAPDLVLPGQTASVNELLRALRSDEVLRRIGPLE